MTTLVRIDDQPGRVISAMLRDGTTVRVRPLAAGDDAALRRFVGELSQESVRQRFLAALDGDRALRALSHTFSPDDRVLVAERGSPSEIVGHAGCFMAGPDRAEGAYLVADAWQGRGLGSLLLSCVAEVARANGASWLFADVLPYNRGMLRVFERSGYPVDIRPGPFALQVELRIQDQAPALPRAA